MPAGKPIRDDDDNNDDNDNDNKPNDSMISSSHKPGSTPFPQKHPETIPKDSDESDDTDDADDADETNDDDDDETAAARRQKASSTLTTTSAANLPPGHSRYFAPYRTVGVVAGSPWETARHHPTPFVLMPHDHSANGVVVVPAEDRFVLWQTDHLRPIFVSRTVPHPTSNNDVNNKSNSNRRGRSCVGHLVTEGGMETTLVSHGTHPGRVVSTSQELSLPHVTLFHRTHAVQTLTLARSQQWTLQGLLHLGHTKAVEKKRSHQDQRTKEETNGEQRVWVVAALLRKQTTSAKKRRLKKGSDGNDVDDDDHVPTVGEDEDDDDDADAMEDEDASDSEGEGTTESSSPCHGQVVILVATRQRVWIEKRIDLSTVPDFVPTVMVHPATYLNKIVIGGWTTTTTSKQNTQLILLNYRSGKLIHNFACLAGGGKKHTTAKKRWAARVTTVEQSPAVDTLAVGTQHGLVHLVNLRYDRKLFSLAHKSKIKPGEPVAITSISFRNDRAAFQAQLAPMAVARMDGTISIWDLGTNEENEEENEEEFGKSSQSTRRRRTLLTELDKVHLGGVAKIQFFPQEPLLISSGVSSNAIRMHIFDNPDHSGRILRERQGHSAPPRVIRYLHAGNGLLADAMHANDPALTSDILSTGSSDRTMRIFSTSRTIKDRELGQGKGLKKKAAKYGMDDTTELLLPPCRGMAMCSARSRDWGDLVTIHKNHAFAYVWSTRAGAQTGPVLRQDEWNISARKTPPPPEAHAITVTLSACGNFAIVGTRGGFIYKYNVQSGLPRGRYPPKSEEETTKNTMIGHVDRTLKVIEKGFKISMRNANLDKGEMDAEQRAREAANLQQKLDNASHASFPVTGLAVDALNKTLLSVGSDGKLILWNFQSHAPHKKCPYLLPAGAVRMTYIRESDLAAIALEDHSILIFDCATLKAIRRFGISASGATNSAPNAAIPHHTGPITDLAFGSDGRILYTASMDSTIRVWDLPTNSCVDWLAFPSIPTSLTVSPTGEYMATTHEGQLGLNIWSDRSLYQTIYTNGEAPSKPYTMDEPIVMADNQWASAVSVERPVVDIANNEEVTSDPMGEERGPVKAKEPGLITMSGFPAAHWKNLFRLELVKERNKPKEAPQKPPSAPFFLQWRSGEPMTEKETNKEPDSTENEDEVWASAWGDDEGDNGVPPFEVEDENENDSGKKSEGNTTSKRSREKADGNNEIYKRPKIRHSRSHLAGLLQECDNRASDHTGQAKYAEVFDYIKSLGPSAIDAEFSTLCAGLHDLDEGLVLLHLACECFHEGFRARDRFEAMNAYVHRFLYLHGGLIAGIEDYDADTDNDIAKISNRRTLLLKEVAELRRYQAESSDALREKMQKATCLLRHFTRMV